jgi:type VI secretion system secreted protein Hcp
MRIPGFTGEVSQKGFEGAFELFSFAWGESMEHTTTTASRTGKPQHTDISITKRSDKGSPSLMLACAKGELLPAVQIALIQVIRDRQEVYLRYILDNVLITAYSVGSGGDEVPSESLSLAFTKIEYDQSVQGADGKLDVERAVFDFALNRQG